MSADSKVAEALARIEHKLDVALRLISFFVKIPNWDTTQVGSPHHKCPLCMETVEYGVDPIDSVVVRKCKCKTGKIAIDMKAFAPPAMPVPKQENDSGEQQEDRRNPDPRDGSRRR